MNQKLVRELNRRAELKRMADHERSMSPWFWVAVAVVCFLVMRVQP